MRMAPFKGKSSFLLGMQETIQTKQIPAIKDYEIISKIGQGGIAEIYKARQIALNRPVAIKILFPQLMNDADIVRRFEAESITVGRLNHPNIVHVIDKGKAEDRYYFVMEYVDGTSFKDIVYSKKYSPRQKLEIIVMVLKGLDYAHKNGVIHRDIKPANILVDKQGNALVADFGIAHLVNKSDPEMTSSDMVMGTLAYMSPEQKASSVNVDARSDIYSIGVMVYEILTGSRPMGRFKMPSEIEPKLPKKFDEIVSKCLATDPNDRYQKAVELKDEILNLISRRTDNKAAKNNGYQGVEAFIGKSQFLDTLKETRYSTTMLMENKETHDLFVIKKNGRSATGIKEAKLLTSFKHKNIINIFGAGGDARRLVVVMEYVSGGSLADRMLQPYTLDKAMQIIMSVADALEFAHKNGIVHGNLRPSNILLTNDDEIRVSDFGLPPHYNLKEKNWYIAPEKKVSRQGDIYAIGVMLHQMLFGRNPSYDRSSKLIIGQINIILPKPIEEMLRNLLSIRVSNRYQSIEQFIDDWEAYQRSLEDSKQDRVRPAPKAEKKDYKRIILISSIIAVSVLALMTIYFYSGLFK
jgi:eukaryotic-like serine/threonine-protein kinase